MRKFLIVSSLTAIFSIAADAAIISFANVDSGVWNTGVSASGTPNVVLLNSGVDTSVDEHYILIPPPSCAGPLTANCTEIDNTVFGPNSYVVMDSGFPVANGWAIPNGSTVRISGNPAAQGAQSNWIGPRGNQNNASSNDPIAGNDFYVYRMIFNLSALGLNPSTAQISLRWLSDNNAQTGTGGQSSFIRLCSGLTSLNDGTTPCNAPAVATGNNGQGSTNMTVANINSGFTSGFMSLDFVVYNAGITSGENATGLRVEFLSATASDEQSGVPEPATFALMGLGLIGFAALRRKH